MRRFTLRRYLAFFLPAMFIILCFSLYLMMESVSNYGSGSAVSQKHSENQLEDKLQRIEEDLKANQKTINRIKDLIREIAKDTGRHDWNQILDGAIQAYEAMKPPNISNALVWKKTEVSIPMETCKLAQTVPPKVDIQMRDVFDKLPFDNPDGGVWKQGYPINYDPKQWKTEKLKVFVVPHSHNDPGWIKTFDGYYQDQTRHILNNMVDKLEAYPTMRFVFAEISFFSLWWSHLDSALHNRVKKLVNEKRLEIVSGGWVMTDEAGAHYFAMLDQMIEGNQWLLNELGVKPVSSWAIDPFGYSPTMAYLLHQLGFKNMLIQRIHYSVKKHFSQNKQLEFSWRQIWDHSGSTDMFCHMMPFYSYDVPHTCGPNPRVCCQFDFRRLAGGNLKCPWNIPPVPINPENVAERAETLLDQYRQKSQLYKNNLVIAPLGDDFRYDKAEEWDQQHNNYQQLFDYINSKSEWNAEVRFGTLSDYFDALRERVGKTDSFVPAGYPVLSGDFFTYADRDDHYWSGYFTSRPFYKGLDRLLESHQRSGEILYSLALAEAHLSAAKTFPKEELLRKLVIARRSLGLFQHHDAIAGTAKDFVIADYGIKLLEAINNMKQVIGDSAQFLLTADKANYKYHETVFDVDETRASHDALPKKTVIRLENEPHVVVFYNSLAHNRKTLVTIFVNEPHVEVRNASGVILLTQVSPHWSESKNISSTIYRVSFIATIHALGLAKYSVAKVEAGVNAFNVFASVTIYNCQEASKSQISPFTVEKKSKSEPVSNKVAVENAEMKLHFSLQNGMLEEVFMKDSQDLVRADIAFVRYGTRRGKDRSGAYLFLPDGDAQPLQYEPRPTIRTVEGPLFSEVQVSLPLVVDHTVKVINSPGVESSAIEITNLVDIRQEGNTEVAMRIMTDIGSGNEFFTDLNGFQVLRRKTLEKLPIQANFYPMATMAFLEDRKHRFSLLSGQSLGVASLGKGWLEVMQDRRLDQDDQRGLNQPVHDNKVTPNVFRLLVEQLKSSSGLVVQPAAYPSLLSHLVSQQLLHPVHVLPAGKHGVGTASSLLPAFQPLQHGLPCDLHLVNLRTLLKPEVGTAFQRADETGLILHRFGLDCRFPTKGAFCHLNDSQMSLSSMFRTLPVTKAHLMTLSFGDQLSSVELSSALDIPSMEIRAYSVRLR